MSGWQPGKEDKMKLSGQPESVWRVLGVSKSDVVKALEEDWGDTNVEIWKLRKTAEKRGWTVDVHPLPTGVVDRNGDRLSDEATRRLNMIMTGYASQEEWEAAKHKAGRKPVQVSTARLVNVASDVVKLVMEKNHDYGDAWQALGEVGAAARFVDKMFRIERLVNGQEALVLNEGLTDTLKDLVGYGLLILLYDRYVGMDNPEPMQP